MSTSLRSSPDTRELFLPSVDPLSLTTFVPGAILYAVELNDSFASVLPLTGGTIQSAGSLPPGQFGPLKINVPDLLPGSRQALEIQYNNLTLVGAGEVTGAISVVCRNFAGTVDSLWGISSTVISSSTATLGSFPQDVGISSSLFKVGTNRAFGIHITATESTNLPSSINQSLLGLEIGHHANADDDGGNVGSAGLRLGIHLSQSAANTYPGWVAGTPYAVGDIVNPSGSVSFIYICTVGGTSGGTQPTWPTSTGTVVDGGVTWSFNGFLAVYAFGYNHDGSPGSITKSLYSVTTSKTYQVFDARTAAAPSNYTDPVAALRMSANQIIDFNGASTATSAGWSGPAGSYLKFESGINQLQYVSAGTQLLAIADTGVMQLAGELRITSTPGLPALTIFQEEYISFTNANNRTFGFTQLGALGDRWQWKVTGVEVLSLDDLGLLTVSVQSFTANGSVATALSSVGPAGSHTTVQEWFTVRNSAGVVRYIPAF